MTTPSSATALLSAHPLYVMKENWRSKLPRLADVANHSPATDQENGRVSFFDEFAARLRVSNDVTWRFYKRIDSFLQNISERQWVGFREKLTPYVCKRDPNRHWSQFHDTLFEVFAHEWLLREGAEGLEFIPEESQRKTPDLKGVLDGDRIFVEVKNLNESEEGLSMWDSDESITVKHLVSDQLENKLRSIYNRSVEQLGSVKEAVTDRISFYLVYTFDLDFEPDFGQENDFERLLNKIEIPDCPIIFQKYNS